MTAFSAARETCTNATPGRAAMARSTWTTQSAQSMPRMGTSMVRWPATVSSVAGRGAERREGSANPRNNLAFSDTEDIEPVAFEAGLVLHELAGDDNNRDITN